MRGFRARLGCEHDRGRGGQPRTIVECVVAARAGSCPCDRRVCRRRIQVTPGGGGGRCRHDGPHLGCWSPFRDHDVRHVDHRRGAWILVRALRAEPQRWAPWIGVGLLAGLAMEIKILAAPLLVCCLLGVVAVGPRRRLASLRPWVAALIALILAAPNLIWQATHGFPMAVVATNIASGGSTSSTSRVALLPSVLLDVGLW